MPSCTISHSGDISRSRPTCFSSRSSVKSISSYMGEGIVGGEGMGGKEGGGYGHENGGRREWVSERARQ